LAGAINLTEVDFEQIKQNLINYLKSTKQFTDYDFSGSNLQVILNLLSYQAQLNAYTANMVANESFLSSASLRDNVVSNARMIGYLPSSARCAYSKIDFEFQLNGTDFPQGYPQSLELPPGMMFTTQGGAGNMVFNVIDTQIAPVTSLGVCQFVNLAVYEGTYLPANFVVDNTDFNQKFILMNDNIDTTTIRVEVQENPATDVNAFYKQANNLVELTDESRVYWVEEVDDGFHQLTFGDGYFGRKLQDGAKIFVNYVVTNGDQGNGVQGAENYIFIGKAYDSYGNIVSVVPTVISGGRSEGGAQEESIPSIKFRAPKFYGSQNRAVVASDYDAIIRNLYPAVQDIYVYGGDTLAEPEYGRVYIVVKPTNTEALSSITKNDLKKSLDSYRVASLDIVFKDPVILWVRARSAVYYNDKKTSKDSSGIQSEVKSVLDSYVTAGSISKFGGAVRYSKIVGAIDGADLSITRNVTNLEMRKNLLARLNSSAAYEICFDNPLKITSTESVVQSTGFYLRVDGVVSDKLFYFKDDTKGGIYAYYIDATTGNDIIENDLFGYVDYDKGEIMLGYISGQSITFVDTVEPGGIIKIIAIPRDNDIKVANSVFMDFDVADSIIEAIVDKEVAGS